MSLCEERTCETYKTIDAQYLAETNQPQDFKFARVARSRYLVSLYNIICFVLLNVRDKNPLYGNTASFVHVMLVTTTLITHAHAC